MIIHWTVLLFFGAVTHLLVFANLWLTAARDLTDSGGWENGIHVLTHPHMRIYCQQQITIRGRTMKQSGSRNIQSVATYAQNFKALGDETRVKMIGLLKNKELCVCDLMEVLELPQSTASRHLSYLKNSGWITGKREGKWMYYKLIRELHHIPHLRAMVEYISELPEIIELDQSLENYLEQKIQAGHCPA